jgi:2-dehydropantoate 2-reductase
MIKFYIKSERNYRRMEITKVTIIGLGALGILFGNHLAKKMPRGDLRILADEERIKKYKNDHVYCNGERCDFHYVTPEEYCEPAHLLIFTVKDEGLHAAIQAVRNHVDENTIIISALNGITSEAIIGTTFGNNHILYSVAQGMDAVKVGNKLTYDHMGMLCFGDQKPGIISESVKRVAAFFEKMDFPYQVDTNMAKRLWGKFMLNVGVNQTVAVYRSNYGEIQREGEARETMIAAMREVITLSEYEGINLTEADLNYWLKCIGHIEPRR